MNTHSATSILTLTGTLWSDCFQLSWMRPQKVALALPTVSKATTASWPAEESYSFWLFPKTSWFVLPRYHSKSAKLVSENQGGQVVPDASLSSTRHLIIPSENWMHIRVSDDQTDETLPGPNKVT